MGITNFSNNLLNKYLAGVKTICELGNQTLYFGENYGKPAKPYFESRGYVHISIDWNGLDGALKLDLQDPLKLGPFDLVTDFGTSEHVKDIYMCWKNKHSFCKKEGLIISENPKEGNWPNHGYHYYTFEFYEKISKICKYEILELGTFAAMGNANDGWNVYCVVKKLEDNDFISREAFSEFGLKPK